MKQIKLKSFRVYELSTVIDDIQPKELANLKDIRLAATIVKDLQDGCKEYSEKRNDLSVKQQAILRKYQEELQPKLKDLSKEEQEKLTNEANVKFQAEVNEKFSKDFAALEAKAIEECTIELADDKHDKLCEFFRKFAIQKYIQKAALLEVMEALGIEE